MNDINDRIFEKALCMKRLNAMEKDIAIIGEGRWQLSGCYREVVADSHDLSCVAKAAYKTWYAARVNEWSATAKDVIAHDMLEPSQIGECPHIEIAPKDPVHIWAGYYDLISKRHLQIEYKERFGAGDYWNVSDENFILRGDKEVTSIFLAMKKTEKILGERKRDVVVGIRRRAVRIGMIDVSTSKSIAKRQSFELAGRRPINVPMLVFSIIATALIPVAYFLLKAALS